MGHTDKSGFGFCLSWNMCKSASPRTLSEVPAQTIDYRVIDNQVGRDVNAEIATPFEQDECICPLLMKFITSLRKLGQVEPDVETRALASMVTYYVTGKPTTTTINMRMTLHGITRRKELIETFHIVGAALVMHRCSFCAMHGPYPICSDAPPALTRSPRTELVSSSSIMMTFKTTH